MATIFCCDSESKIWIFKVFLKKHLKTKIWTSFLGFYNSFRRPWSKPKRNKIDKIENTVASLGLVSPGAATEGVTPIFSTSDATKNIKSLKSSLTMSIYLIKII